MRGINSIRAKPGWIYTSNPRSHTLWKNILGTPWPGESSPDLGAWHLGRKHWCARARSYQLGDFASHWHFCKPWWDYLHHRNGQLLPKCSFPPESWLINWKVIREKDQLQTSPPEASILYPHVEGLEPGCMPHDKACVQKRGQACKSCQQQGDFCGDQAGRTKPGLPTGAGVRTRENLKQLT